MSMLKKITVWFAAMFASPPLLASHPQLPLIDPPTPHVFVSAQFDGYLRIVHPSKASADVKRRVSEVNAGRLAEYTRISGEKGDPVATVAAAMAEKQFARATAGEMLKPGPTEPWKKK